MCSSDLLALSARPEARSVRRPVATERGRSVYLTRPLRTHFVRTYGEFSWRAQELLDAIAGGRINITVGERYPLEDAAQAHRDLEGRKTHGSTVLTP